MIDEIKCVGYSEKNQPRTSYKRPLEDAVMDFLVFGQEVVDLIGHNYRNIVSRLSFLIYLCIVNDNEFYYSLSAIFQLCKSNILDTCYPSPRLDHLLVMYILIPRLCWDSSSFCFPFSRRGNVIGAVILLHSYCGFAWTCFTHCAEVSYGLKCWKDVVDFGRCGRVGKIVHSL